MTVDQVVEFGRNLGQQDGAGQIGRAHGGLVQVRAAVIGNIRDANRFDRQVLRVRVEEGQQASDVELENTVRIGLVAVLEWARLKGLSEGRCADEDCGRPPSRLLGESQRGEHLAAGFAQGRTGRDRNRQHIRFVERHVNRIVRYQAFAA